ncbi:MAG: hypothetical protein QOI80_774 [Solirubrobacteraceae bacterium]|nr:hypothetical protein [Solirubrobacteraceae bacterium]
MPSARWVCALLFLVLAPAAAAAPVHFTEPLLIDQARAGGEPVMWTDPIHKSIVYSSHAGTTHLYRPGLASGGALDFASTYRNQVFMWRSTDDGRTFQRIDYAGGFVTDPSKNTGFSDPDFTQDAGGRIYNTGIDLVNTALFSSPDGGQTWDAGTVQCVPGDRPWLAGGAEDEVFLASNVDAPAPGDPTHQVFQSTDAGRTCPVRGIPAAGQTESGEDWTGNGKILFDQATQTVVEPANFMAGGGAVTGVGIDTYKRGDAGFVPSKAADSSMFAHWPAIAIDDGGTLYLVWDDAPVSETANDGCNGDPSPLPNHILMAYTKDLGKTWSAPIQVAAPSDHLVFWPWVAAGEAGKVSVVWYETDKVVDVGCMQSQLSIKAATILHADDDAHRTTEVTDAVGRPIADSDLCLSGTTCVATGEDRRLGDFFTNSVGLDGCVQIASGDTTHKDPVTGGELPTSRPIFLRQNSGPRLRGSGDCSGAEDPGGSLGLPSTRKCTPRRRLVIRLRAPRHAKLRSAKVFVDGKRVKVRRRHGRLRAVIHLRAKTRGRFVVRIVARTTRGKVVRSKRVYRRCVKRNG